MVTLPFRRIANGAAAPSNFCQANSFCDRSGGHLFHVLQLLLHSLLHRRHPKRHLRLPFFHFCGAYEVVTTDLTAPTAGCKRGTHTFYGRRRENGGPRTFDTCDDACTDFPTESSSLLALMFVRTYITASNCSAPRDFLLISHSTCSTHYIVLSYVDTVCGTRFCLFAPLPPQISPVRKYAED